MQRLLTGRSQRTWPNGDYTIWSGRAVWCTQILHSPICSMSGQRAAEHLEDRKGVQRQRSTIRLQLELTYLKKPAELTLTLPLAYTALACGGVSKPALCPGRTNQQVLNYLHAENAYTAAVLAPMVNLTEELYAEMAGRIPASDVSDPPQRYNGFYYYEYRVPGGQFMVKARCTRPLQAMKAHTQ